MTTVVGTAGETITAPSRSFTLGGSVGTKLSIEISPVTDPIRLNNAAAIYRYILYPGPMTPPMTEPKAAKALREAIQFPVDIDDPNGAVTVSKTLLVYPQCILCLIKNDANKTLPNKIARDDVVNHTEVNPNLGWGWLHSELSPAAHTLGIHNGHTLSMPEADYLAGHLRTLVLLVMQIPSPPATADGKSK